MTKEKISSSPEQHAVNNEQLSQEAREHQERLRNNIERSVENKSHENIEDARREALERASSKEHEIDSHEATPEQSPQERRDGPISHQEKNASFKRTMKDVQAQMPARSRVFSKIIHNKAVEKTSDTAATTIARPNAILSGSISAFVITLIVLLVARHFGYPLSGFESIAAFIVGWIVGILFDFLRAMITGKTN